MDQSTPIINKNNNISILSSKFGIENVSIKSHWLLNLHWLPKMYKTLH